MDLGFTADHILLDLSTSDVTGYLDTVICLDDERITVRLKLTNLIIKTYLLRQ